MVTHTYMLMYAKARYGETLIRSYMQRPVMVTHTYMLIYAKARYGDTLTCSYTYAEKVETGGSLELGGLLA